MNTLLRPQSHFAQSDDKASRPKIVTQTERLCDVAMILITDHREIFAQCTST
jgi:hypothetical protein